MRAKKDAHSGGKVPREMGAGRGRVDGKAGENHTVAREREWTKPQGSGVNNALIVPKRLDFPRGGPGGRWGAAGAASVRPTNTRSGRELSPPRL